MNKRFNLWFREIRKIDVAPFLGVMSRNWILKLICLVLAVAVWAVLREKTSMPKRIENVPVTIIVREGRAVLSQSSDVVSIDFRGSREDIRFINRDQLTVEVDLTQRPDELRQKIRLTDQMVHVSSRARVVEFIPKEIELKLDRKVDRILPIKAMLDGQLPEGIELEKAVCTPATVKVYGAEQHVMKLELLRTTPIRLDKQYSTFETHVAVAAKNQPWTATPERISVFVELKEQSGHRSFENKTVRALFSAGDFQRVTVTPVTVKIFLKGSQEHLDILSDEEVFAYVDCTKVPESPNYELAVHAHVPGGIRVEKIEPKTVNVAIKKM